MARRQCQRSKPKKKPNRYNPNNPKYWEVHGTMLGGKIVDVLLRKNIALSRVGVPLTC